MYARLPNDKQTQYQKLVSDIAKEVFTYLNLEYQVHNISINSQETLYTVFVPSINKNKSLENYYIGHGFGGSSLMKFPLIEPLIKKGNVIFWEIRGMGLNTKLERYPISDLSQIQHFFISSISHILKYYQPNNATFICHSFSSYLLLVFILRYPYLAEKHIKQLLLLSPIGITIKEQDYKNEIRNCSDVIYSMISKIGWTFHLTYKSPLRSCCSCCKSSLINNRLMDTLLDQKQKQIMCRFVQTLILLPDGSQSLFFQYFESRVLPRIALQPLFVNEPPVKIIMAYGGIHDWVDKTGALKISQRFPNKISMLILQNCGHNIPFYPKECKELFDKLI